MLIFLLLVALAALAFWGAPRLVVLWRSQVTAGGKRQRAMAIGLADLLARPLPSAIAGSVMAAVKGKGAKVFLWDSTIATPALVELPELLTVGPPRPSRDTIDTTHHGSIGDYREFISNLIDAGELTVGLHYLPGSAGDILMLDAFADGDLRTWKIVVNAPGGTQRQITGSGLVTEYGPDDVAIDDKMVATLSIKVSGPITVAAYTP